VKGTLAVYLISHFLYCTPVCTDDRVYPRSGLGHKSMHSGRDVITMRSFGEHLVSPNH